MAILVLFSEEFVADIDRPAIRQVRADRELNLIVVEILAVEEFGISRRVGERHTVFVELGQAAKCPIPERVDEFARITGIVKIAAIVEIGCLGQPFDADAVVFALAIETRDETVLVGDIIDAAGLMNEAEIIADALKARGVASRQRDGEIVQRLPVLLSSPSRVLFWPRLVKSELLSTLVSAKKVLAVSVTLPSDVLSLATDTPTPTRSVNW